MPKAVIICIGLSFVPALVLMNYMDREIEQADATFAPLIEQAWTQSRVDASPAMLDGIHQFDVCQKSQESLSHQLFEKLWTPCWQQASGVLRDEHHEDDIEELRKRLTPVYRLIAENRKEKQEVLDECWPKSKCRHHDEG